MHHSTPLTKTTQRRVREEKYEWIYDWYTICMEYIHIDGYISTVEFVIKIFIYTQKQYNIKWNEMRWNDIQTPTCNAIQTWLLKKKTIIILYWYLPAYHICHTDMTSCCLFTCMIWRGKYMKCMHHYDS